MFTCTIAGGDALDGQCFFFAPSYLLCLGIFLRSFFPIGFVDLSEEWVLITQAQRR